jgi:conjugal transfer mating pair stabilization protein TraG
MNFEVYAYWNIEELTATFNAVAALMGSGDYLGLLRTLALVGILSLALVVLAGKGRMEDFWKWVIMLALFNGMLLVPKTNVIVVDRTGTTPAQVVANVPIGLAAFAHSTSKIGDWLTGSFETVFALPGDLQFRTSGTLFGHRVLQERLAIKSGQPILTSNFYEFYRECITPELASGYIRMNDLMKTNDIWGTLNGLTNPSRLVTLRDTADPTIMQTVGCTAAYTTLTTPVERRGSQSTGPAGQSDVSGNALRPGQYGDLRIARDEHQLSSRAIGDGDRYHQAVHRLKRRD